jgi:hypothetical protein
MKILYYFVLGIIVLLTLTNCEISWLEIEYYYESPMNSDLIVNGDNIYLTRNYKFSPKGRGDLIKGFIFYKINIVKDIITKDTIILNLDYEPEDIFLSGTNNSIFITAYNGIQPFRYDYSDCLLNEFDAPIACLVTCLSYSPDEKEFCLGCRTCVIYRNELGEIKEYYFNEGEIFVDYEVDWENKRAYYLTTKSLNMVDFENDSTKKIISIGDSISESIISDMYNINLVDSIVLLLIEKDNEWDNPLTLKIESANETYLFKFYEKSKFYQSSQGLYYNFDYIDRTEATLEIYDKNYSLIKIFSL